MRIEVTIQSHNFERRLCWMLSSLAEQVRHCDYTLGVSVACLEGPTLDVVNLFAGHGLNVKPLVYKDLATLQPRNQTRNRALAETDADWMVFADSDIVYPPNFMCRLVVLLRGPHKDDQRCLCPGKATTRLNEVEALVGPWAGPARITEAYAKAMSLTPLHCRPSGAGYCQIASVAAIKEKHGGKYWGGRPWKDVAWSDCGRNGTRTDRSFRLTLGSAPIELPEQIHLQHSRKYLTGGRN